MSLSIEHPDGLENCFQLRLLRINRGEFYMMILFLNYEMSNCLEN